MHGKTHPVPKCGRQAGGYAGLRRKENDRYGQRFLCTGCVGQDILFPCKAETLRGSIGAVPDVPSGENPAPFNLISACHHVCGAVAAFYESNECIIDDFTGPHLSHEQILRMHEILFEECFAMVQGK